MLVVAFVLVILMQGARRHGGTPAPTTPAPTPTPRPVVAASTGDRVLIQDGQSLLTRGHALVNVRSANGDNPQVAIDAGAGPVRYQLVGAPAARLVWVVGPGFVRAFDDRNLVPRSPVLALPGVTELAVLDGVEYAATGTNVLRLPAADVAHVDLAGPRVVDSRGAAHLAADQTRHRLLVLDGTRVGVAGSRLAATLPSPGTALAVVDGGVWVLGAAALYRLDPGTLRVAATVTLLPGARLAAVGPHSLLVQQGTVLSCLDPKRRVVAQSWPQVPLPVGYDPDGMIYSMPAGGLPAALTFGGCPG